MTASDWHVATWVDDGDRTWRVERSPHDGLWQLKRYTPGRGWQDVGLYMSRDEALRRSESP